jgi:hypothetical protein
LGVVVVSAILLGGYVHARDRDLHASFINRDFLVILAMTFSVISLSSTAAWGVWTGIVRLFLRKPVADALLNWQQGLSQPALALGRE